MKIITTENASATQTEHPTRAAVRTFIQTLIPALPLLVLAVPPVVEVILDETTRHGVTLPGWAYSALAGTAVVCALIAAIVARIMAIPAVEKALRGINLGAAPTDPDFGTWDGGSDEAEVDDLSDEAELQAVEEVDLTPPPAGYEPRH